MTVTLSREDFLDVSRHFERCMRLEAQAQLTLNKAVTEREAVMLKTGLDPKGKEYQLNEETLTITWA